MNKEPKKSTIQEIVIGDKKIVIDTTKDYFADLITDKDYVDSEIAKDIEERILKGELVFSFPKEPIDKIYDFIKLINDFICTLLPHNHLEEDYKYGITILSDIEQAQRQIETRFDKHWNWNKLAFENLWNKEQIDLMKKIIEGLKEIKEDTILGIDIDTIIKSDYAFEDFTKESIQNMHKNGDDWGIVTDTETKEKNYPDDSHNYFVTTQSILSTLLNRCSFLNIILYNPIISTLELYDNVYNINTTLLELSNLTAEKTELLENIADNETARIFGMRLSMIMDCLDMKNAELANRLGVSRQVVTEWKKGTKKPTLEKIVKIATILNTTTDYLLRENADRADFEKTHMEQNYGLSENSVEKLKKIKNNKIIAGITNLLISKYRECEKGDDVDILSKLAGYLLFDLLDEEDMCVLFIKPEAIEETEAFEELTEVINRVREKITTMNQEN